MSYYVVVDSCGELTDEMKKSGHFCTASLTITVDGHHIIDDETFDQKAFLREMAQSPNAPKSACPSPEIYEKAFETEADHLYAVTLSAELSGSFNSARTGRMMCLEKHPHKKIHVFNSRSASVGETLIACKIREYEEQGLSFNDVVEKVEEYIDSQTTWFVLESLENLRKNGRLSNLKAKVASVLHIKPVMKSTQEGNIMQLCQCRGINKALVSMVENICSVTENAEERILGIANCNCRERALMVRDAILERMHVKDVVIVDTAGTSSLYAENGGIIVVI